MTRMSSRILAIGGGQGKGRETAPPEKLAIDAYIAAEAKKIAGDRRPCGLFIPTASHDCMPYYNTFHRPHGQPRHRHGEDAGEV